MFPEFTWIVPVTFTLGSSRQSIVALVGVVVTGHCGRTWSGVVSDLVMLVIVNAFDDINLPVLKLYDETI